MLVINRYLALFLMLVIVSIIAAVGGSDHVDSSSKSDVVKSRQKRIVFPLNAAMGIIFALAIPLGIPSRNIFMSYNFEGNYNNPADANIFSEGFANYIKGIVEPLTAPSRPVEQYGIRKRSNEDSPKSKRPVAQITRRQIYKTIEKHLQTQHFHGSQCLSRMICEAALHPFSEANGLIGDLMQIMLSPSSSMYENLPHEYSIAEQSGREGSCEKYRRGKCPKDPLEIVSVLTVSIHAASGRWENHRQDTSERCRNSSNEKDLIGSISLKQPHMGTQNTTHPEDEGRFLIRGKPILIYPPTAPTRHQLIVGIGVPVQEIPHSVVFGWVLKAQYYLPTVTQNYDPIYLDNWNDSRRAFPDRTRRSIERYEMDNIRIQVEPLPPEEHQSLSDDDFDYYGEENLDEVASEGVPEGTSKFSEAGTTDDTKQQPPKDFDVTNGRWTTYKTIERLSDGYGLGGKVCMLRSICEAAEAQFTHTGGVFAELLHIMFTPSSTREPILEHLDNEYHRAEQLGRSGAPCAEIFRECSTSLLDMFSGVHDLHQPTSSFFTGSTSGTYKHPPPLRVWLAFVPSKISRSPKKEVTRLTWQNSKVLSRGYVLTGVARLVLSVTLAAFVAADFIPWLIVPETAPTRHQLISGIGIPVGTPESITSGWVMKAQYFLPTKVDDLKPELWENWNDSRRALVRRDLQDSRVPVVRLPTARGYERYDISDVELHEESLPEEQFDDGDDNYWMDVDDDRMLQQMNAGQIGPPAQELEPSQLLGYSAEQSRWTTYKSMEKLSETYGLPGRPCVLRSVCEAAAAPFTHTGGIFAELLHIMFTPSSTTEELGEHRDNEYFRAEQLGRTGAPCERIFAECVHSLLDVFTGVHDPETGTMQLLHDQVRAFLMRK
ncbi:uncharacterized protein LOC128723001 [Anopheles nili]|uniref:uncharacterized protein LOC128723001 n=1 Tax=Anopheles nili TaxID=185578 RepID=UPI00237B84AC|nr:uncharacterized protein LOC128723001 [Anopheles nili]